MSKPRRCIVGLSPKKSKSLKPSAGTAEAGFLSPSRLLRFANFRTFPFFLMTGATFLIGLSICKNVFLMQSSKATSMSKRPNTPTNHHRIIHYTRQTRSVDNKLCQQQGPIKFSGQFSLYHSSHAYFLLRNILQFMEFKWTDLGCHPPLLSGNGY